MSKRMYSVFNRSPTPTINLGTAGYYPFTTTFLGGAEKSIVGAIFNRIAIDVSNNKFMHVKVDGDGYIAEIPDSPINKLLLYRPNINQSPKQFIRDIVLSLCNEGVVAIVNTEWDKEHSPQALQVGLITNWYSDYVTVKLFNNETQSFEEAQVKKCACAIIENPLYTVMNDNGSSIRRLIEKLGQMDNYTAAATSGQIRAFVGLDYDTTTAMGTKKAEQRINSIHEQMSKSKYGVIFHENTEKITFPNKPIDIDIADQVKYLEEQVFAELGMTRDVFIGTAKEDANRQYQAKTVEPFCTAISEALTYMFVTRDMYRAEKIIYTKPLFAGVTGPEFAEITDKLSRNAVVKSNEVRLELGLLKSDEAQANMLMNPNMPMGDQPMTDQYENPGQPLSNNVFSRDPQESENQNDINIMK